jgi:hypothetical protein
MPRESFTFMEVEVAKWQRRKTLAPGKLVSPETTYIIESENPFTPLARYNSGG